MCVKRSQGAGVCTCILMTKQLANKIAGGYLLDLDKSLWCHQAFDFLLLFVWAFSDVGVKWAFVFVFSGSG